MERVYLDRFEKKDVHYLYKAMGSQEQYLFTTRLPVIEPVEFESWLHGILQTDFHDFQMVRISQGGLVRTAGFVHDYDFNLKDGNTKMTAYIDEEYRSAGVGGIAGVLFLGLLFDKYPLRTIYSTVYDYNERSLKSALDAGFTEEGSLKDYRYQDGEWFDLHVLSLSRSRFDSRLRRLYEQWS